jgi:hypothetical protein
MVGLVRLATWGLILSNLVHGCVTLAGEVSKAHYCNDSLILDGSSLQSRTMELSFGSTQTTAKVITIALKQNLCLTHLISTVSYQLQLHDLLQRLAL